MPYLLYNATTSVASGHTKLLEFFQTTGKMTLRQPFKRNPFCLKTTSTQLGCHEKGTLPTTESANDELVIQSITCSRSRSYSISTGKSSKINLLRVLLRRCPAVLEKLQRDVTTFRTLLFIMNQKPLLFAHPARLEMYQASTTVS